MMDRIYIDRGNAPPMTGIGNYTDSLTEALRSAAGPGIIVGEVPASSIGNGWRPMHRLRYFWKLHRFLRSGAAAGGLVHFTNIYVPPKVPGVTYAVTIHDLDPLMLPDMHSVQYAAYFAYIVKRSIERADLILTDTVSVQRELIQRFRIPEHKVRDLGVGISSQFMESADRSEAQRPEVPMLLFVGQLNMKKNVRWLIETFSSGIRTNRIPRVRLVLAGGAGHGIGPIRDLLNTVDPSVVEWVHRPSLEQLTAMYRSCAAVVVPSLREGFGIPLLEAMYCRRPIVASDIPTNREVAGSAAEFFTLDDPGSFYAAVNNALQDRNVPLRMTAAREQLERYQWGSIAERCLTYYDELLRGVRG